ncbi:MAG: acetoacetate decarboxylase, partial [Rickettsiales bacterium]|nr:acetoacetate decarboxylase [Rickettsiales bacterium]
GPCPDRHKCPSRDQARVHPAPSYPKGPYRFINREYFIIMYESDPDAIRHALPEPLEPAQGNLVAYEFIKMPDSSGFGDYTESGIVIPCLFEGKEVNFTCQMYLDNEPPLTGGREIWGFPKKYGNPDLKVIHDTLTGFLRYADQLVSMGTMSYKTENLISNPLHAEMRDPKKIVQKLTKTQINLKLIPGVDGKPAIAQLVAYNMCDVTVKGAWSGHARLHLVPHVNAPVADFPVRKIIGGSHFIADITLPYGRVIHDYLKEDAAQKKPRSQQSKTQKHQKARVHVA